MGKASCHPLKPQITGAGNTVGFGRNSGQLIPGEKKYSNGKDEQCRVGDPKGKPCRGRTQPIVLGREGKSYGFPSFDFQIFIFRRGET